MKRRTKYILFYVESEKEKQIAEFDTWAEPIRQIYLILLNDVVNHNCRIEDIRNNKEVIISLKEPWYGGMRLGSHYHTSSVYKIRKISFPQHDTQAAK